MQVTWNLNLIMPLVVDKVQITSILAIFIDTLMS